ncbi:MAG: STAS domain-containing protein [Planctomycetaceae bacterium]|nr:STAS domain-containing protein [Planctomycetaceae bacterium]
MKIDEIDGTIYCRFEESVNANVCSDVAHVLAEQIESALARTPGIKVVFDMNGTRYISSAFLRLCVLYHKKVGKENFRCENVSDDVQSVFLSTGLDGILVEKR